MASIIGLYAAKFRENLSYHPVWQPGTGLVPGDVGVMKDGVFVREGHVSQLQGSVVPEPTQQTLAAPMKFSVGVTAKAAAQGGAQVDPALKVEASLKFGSNGGVVFDARDRVQHALANLGLVLAALDWGSPEFDDVVVVSEVHSARVAALAVAVGSEGEVELSGSLKALKALDVGDASVSFGATTGAAYALQLRASDQPHPVALRLYGASRSIWGRRSRPELLGAGDPAAAPLPAQPFVELSPFAIE
ncbi:hypothetical protein [Roseomonas fluvialis]|uniref:Uncharacterized protein n=1 Tax=Roseomonas fluvialis TaxID=1750527 RepID=A0ABN6P5H8_9PROT|nr:hypothetical protein [Roseomonas fluvialis]BDG73927.1 hypothetical protein Rmf_38560 [Roseomonas fluvialis]